MYKVITLASRQHPQLEHVACLNIVKAQNLEATGTQSLHNQARQPVTHRGLGLISPSVMKSGDDANYYKVLEVADVLL